MRQFSTLFVSLTFVIILALSMGMMIAAAQVNSSEPNLQSTEEPTDSLATEEPGLAVTEAVSGPQSLAYLRLAHFALDAPSYEVLVDGQPSDIQGLNPGAISGWVEMLAGEYAIQLVPVDAGADAVTLGPINYALSPQTWTTIAVVGSAEAGTLAAQVIREDYSAIDEAMARVTVLHTLENGAAVDVVRADGSVLASNIAYAGSGTAINTGSATFEVPAGTNDLQIVSTDGTLLLDLAGLELQGGNFYLIAITGTADGLGVKVESIALTTLQERTNAEFLPGEPGTMATEEPGIVATEEPDMAVTEEAGIG